MRRSGNREENKRILMDLDVVLKSHDCPYIVQCFGTFITNVSPHPTLSLLDSVCCPHCPSHGGRCPQCPSLALCPSIPLVH